MLFFASSRLTLLLSILLLPCIVYCHQDTELENNIPHFDDVVAYLLDPRGSEYGDMDESNNADEDESAFDFVGNSLSHTSKAEDAIPNDELGESAVKKDSIDGDKDSSASSLFGAEKVEGEHAVDKKPTKKDKVEYNIDDDDELFAGKI